MFILRVKYLKIIRSILNNIIKIPVIVFFIIAMQVIACEKNDSDGLNEQDNQNENPNYHSLGLQVDNNGVLMKNGKPYRGVGVNYFDAFLRALKSSDTSYIKGFQDLKSLNIPFVRFNAGGFWPIDWKLYKENKGAYFSKLDRLVQNAEKIGIGLIPSLFWHNATIPDLVGETVNQWGNPNSKTIEFMRKYTEEVVKRYADSPSIWGWEFSNEFNLSVDIPGEVYPQVAVSLGTPATRSAADKKSTRDLNVAMEEFVKAVRRDDASRIIFSGNSIPRESAYNLFLNQSWTKDNVDQYTQMLDVQNPDPLNSVTIHVYPQSVTNRFPPNPPTIKEIVQITMGKANKLKKPLFIGEWGASIGVGVSDLMEQRNVLMNMIQIIEDEKVPLAAYWVFDYSPQESMGNATLTNSRKYILEEIGKLNGRIRAELGQ